VFKEFQTITIEVRAADGTAPMGALPVQNFQIIFDFPDGDDLANDQIRPRAQDQSWSDTAPNVPDQLRAWYGLARCLLAGTSIRRALPLETVLAILRFAGCITRTTISIKEGCKATSRSHEVAARTPWFITQPWTRPMLTNVAQIQLVTSSQDQGWCEDRSQRSYSWFEVEIMQSVEGTLTPKTHPETGRPLRWTSHHNVLAGGPKRDGEIIDLEHDIWRHIEEGDSIQVDLCAQGKYWDTFAEEGELRIWYYLEPVFHALTK